MAAFEVSWVLLREAVRAAATPFRLLAWLPRRQRWVDRATEVLQRPATDRGNFDHASADATDGHPTDGHPTDGPAGRTAGRPHVFLSAGETSGDIHGAHLIQACRAAAPTPWRLTCYGGTHMAAAGGELLHPLAEQGIMGLGGVLKGLPTIVRAFSRYLDLLDRDPPDLVVLIDYPGLHLVMAEAARRRAIPVVHYVAPQYWAWGPWRMGRYRRAMTATLTILPFEAGFFRDVGLPATYVGHPLLDELAGHPPDPVAVAEVLARPTLVLMPGSRRAEIEANLPGMLRVAERMRIAHPDLRAVVIHRDSQLRAPIEATLTRHPDAGAELRVGALGPWLRGARVVLAKSGTGSLEACLHGNPTVVVYKVGRFGHWAYRRLLTVPYVAGANLIAGRQVVPEFVFHDDRSWQTVADHALALWPDGPQRLACLEGLAEVRRRLGEPGAAARVAALLPTFLGPPEFGHHA